MSSKTNTGSDEKVNTPSSTVHTSSLSPAAVEAEERGNRLIEQHLNNHAHTKLLTAEELIEYTNNDCYQVSQNISNKKIMSVKHRGETYYPAFQFDPDSRKLRSWVLGMIEILDELDLDGRSFAVWSVIPSDRFGGDAPIEHMDDEDFFSTAAASLTPV